MDYLIDVIAFLKFKKFQWKGWSLISELKIDAESKRKFIEIDGYEGVQTELENNKGELIDIDDVRLGEVVKVVITLPRNQDLFVAKDISDLVERTKILSIPDKYVLFDVDFFSWRDDVKKIGAVFAHDKIIEFINLCIKLDVLEKHYSSNKLVLFFSNEKLLISSELDASILSVDVGNDFERIILKFNSDQHKSDRVHMLRASLFKVLNKCSENKRLIHLTSNSSKFVRLFEQNYDLFVSDFSFDSEKEKVFAEKRDFLSKLSQLLSGIQAKLLAIPLSLVLVLGQMKTKPDDSPLMVNSLILASSLLFSVIMFVLLRSQLTAINAISHEVKSKRNRFELELPDLYSEVSLAFDSVSKQCEYNRFFICFMIVVVVLGFLGTVVAYAMLTPQLHKFISECLVSYIPMACSAFDKISDMVNSILI